MMHCPEFEVLLQVTEVSDVGTSDRQVHLTCRPENDSPRTNSRLLRMEPIKLGECHYGQDELHHIPASRRREPFAQQLEGNIALHAPFHLNTLCRPHMTPDQQLQELST